MIKTKSTGISVDSETRPVELSAMLQAFSIPKVIEPELKWLQENGVIEPVREFEVTLWVSPLVPVRKCNGTLRLRVDYRLLNKSIRERHMLPTLDEITAMLEGFSVFSVLDTESRFHQSPLTRCQSSPDIDYILVTLWSLPL